MNPINNSLVVGTRGELGRDRLVAERFNWVGGAPPAEAVRAEVKIRYRSQPQMALVKPMDDDRALIEFDEPQQAITPGQAAVVYQGDVCLGGGVIAQFAGEQDDLKSKDQMIQFIA